LPHHTSIKRSAAPALPALGCNSLAVGTRSPGTMVHMPNSELVSGTDLDRWADSPAAQSVLRHMVRRPILANASVTQVTLRASEEVGVPGRYGVVGNGWRRIPTGGREAAVANEDGASKERWRRPDLMT